MSIWMSPRTDSMMTHSVRKATSYLLTRLKISMALGTAIEVVSLNGERVVAGTHTILATRRGSVPVVGFGGQLFQSAALRTGIKREAQGAKVYGITANRISAIPVPVPPTEAEQQRIATCLSSLEDVLPAQARKIDALKQQKQGLLQQLFSSLEAE